MADSSYGKLEFAVGFKPQSAFPLDVRTYFESKSAAEAAASSAKEAGSTESIYYIGQLLTVYDKADNSLTTYKIAPDKTLVRTADESNLSSMIAEIDLGDTYVKKVDFNKTEIGLGNVDNVKQYSESNPPPYPVTSVSVLNVGVGDVIAKVQVNKGTPVEIRSDSLKSTVLYTPQTLEDSQKSVARQNISAAAEGHTHLVSAITDFNPNNYVRSSTLVSNTKDAGFGNCITQIVQGGGNITDISTAKIPSDLNELSGQIPTSVISGLTDDIDSRISSFDYSSIKDDLSAALSLSTIASDERLSASISSFGYESIKTNLSSALDLKNIWNEMPVAGNSKLGGIQVGYTMQNAKLYKRPVILDGKKAYVDTSYTSSRHSSSTNYINIYSNTVNYVTPNGTSNSIAFNLQTNYDNTFFDSIVVIDNTNDSRTTVPCVLTEIKLQSGLQYSAFYSDDPDILTEAIGNQYVVFTFTSFNDWFIHVTRSNMKKIA